MDCRGAKQIRFPHYLEPSYTVVVPIKISGHSHISGLEIFEIRDILGLFFERVKLEVDPERLLKNMVCAESKERSLLRFGFVASGIAT